MPNDHHGLLQRFADFITDRTPTGEYADFPDNTSIEPASPRPRRRPLYTAGKVYSADERRKLHQAVDVCIDRQRAKRAKGQRARDSWSEDLQRGAATTLQFADTMDDLSRESRRYVEHSQERWPGVTNFTRGLPLAYTSEQARKLAPRWKAAIAKRNAE